MPSDLALTLAALTLTMPLSGCASATKISVQSSAQTNRGNTLYMLVRTIDTKGVASERYDEIAAKVFADPPDATVIASQPVFPGNPVTLNLKDQGSKDLVVYFLYTNPGQAWRVPLRAPLSSEIEIRLGENQIEHVDTHKK